MHTMSVRAAARRTSRAATLAAVVATSIAVAPAPASAKPAPSSLRVEAAADLVAPSAHPVRVERQAAERLARLRAERRDQREAERAEQAARSRGEQILELASREAGDPYVWGAAGPSSFDCSGFTQYVFAQVGISLPHSSSAQAGVATPVSDPQPGDLVFFGGSGGIYHVAIYAGDGMIWHAPRSGDVVKLEAMWTTSGVSYGRV